MSDASDKPYFPELSWRGHVAWRGEPVYSENAAYKMADAMASRLRPTVTSDGQPALAVEGLDDLFVLDWPFGDLKYRKRAAVACAARVVAELTCDAAPETAWEAAVVSGDHVLWAPYYSEYVSHEAALEKATKVLVDNLRPAAYERYGSGQDGRGEEWDAHIEHRNTSDSIDVECIRAETPFPTKAGAWRHAAELLARAEAAARKVPYREPAITASLADLNLSISA